MIFKGQRVTLIGLGLRSGVAVAQLLDDLGARVRVSDLRSLDQLSQAVEQLGGRSIEFVLGSHPVEMLDDTDLIVVSPGVPWEAPILVEARTRGIPILGELEVASQVCRAPIVAITGTKGKSTTTALVGHMLRESGDFPKVLVGGNIGLAFSRDVRQLTTEDIAVIEVSSFQLEAITRFHPTVSMVTNIHPDHLDRHGTMAAYIAAKQRLFLNQTPQDFAVLNASDPHVRCFGEHTQAQTAWFSVEGEVACPHIQRCAYLQRDELRLRNGDEVDIVCTRQELRLLGLHNVANALAACLVASILGTTVEATRRALRHAEPSPHTLEIVRQIGSVRFINDSKATNVVATQAALEAFDPPVILIMGGYDKGNDYAPLIPLVRERVHHLILMGPDTRKIAAALGEQATTTEVADMREAMAAVRRHLVDGATVLLSPACASFDLFEDYSQRGETFRQEVLRL